MAAAKKDESADDEKEKPEGEGAEGEGVDLPKKKIAGKKLVLIIVAVAILLIGGAGAGLYFSGILGGKDKAEGEHGEEQATDEHGDGAEGEHASGSPVYYEMPTVLVNLTSTGRRPVYAKVRVQLVLSKDADRSKLTENQPRIVDSFQTYLREMTPEELQGSAGLMRLREELLLRVNAAVAPVVVKDLLFQEILPQ